MTKPFALFALCSAAILAGCADTNVSRNAVADGPLSLVSFADLSQHENTVSQQADALNDLSGDLVRASSTKGVKVGLAVGCGLALVSATSTQQCLTTAAVGGVAGAVTGRQAGKHKVAKRVELVNPNRLVRNIRKTNDKMDSLSGSLPELLTAQDQELEALSLKRDLGTLSQASYEKRYNEIKAHRADLAHSLSLSAKQAGFATRNLENAATRGQTGLEWHLGAAQKIEERVESARSKISLL